MAALPNLTPHGAARPNPSQDDAPKHHGDAVLLGGDVPIAVWRLDDRDDNGPALTPGGRLASRLAQRLVLVYTRRGDAVVDFDSDPQLEHASAHTSRSYLSITNPREVADLDALTDPVSLVILRWPPRQTTRTPVSIADLFAACRLIMTADTCAIVAVSSAAPGEPGTTYAERLGELLPAARAVGLTHILHIVAVTAPGDADGDEFLYYATRADAEAARQGWPAGDNAPSYSADLLVFTNRSRDD
ncbi:hypothetical protein ABIH81_19440 [Micromonospora sp. HUAS YX12]|uniref:Uncharacterized protein n=1 Tax=Micromonospora sp. HUAS YX12 TaxID=3156396 RepID=A0AAU7QUE9_9ACTN